MEHIITSAVFNLFSLDEDLYRIIPYNYCPTKFYKIEFEGWSHFSFTENDETFSILRQLCKKSIKNFVDIYEKTHAFTQPHVGIKPDGIFFISIGTLEIDIYENRLLRKDSQE